MYVLVYDERDPAKPLKEVLSVHRSRETAEKALLKRQRRLSKRVYDCETRIAWIDGKVKAGEFVPAKAFSTWRPGEKVPWGDQYSDVD